MKQDKTKIRRVFGEAFKRQKIQEIDRAVACEVLLENTPISQRTNLTIAQEHTWVNVE